MPAGRPPKLTPQLISRIADCFLCAFTDQQTADLCGINEKTIRRMRVGGLCPQIKKLELHRELAYRQKIWDAKGFWQGAAWFLERKYPTQFAKPEIQLSFNSTYNQNNLSINISAPEAKSIEAEAKPVREAVADMFHKYRPAGSNGNDTP
jgi:hypothetical protein